MVSVRRPTPPASAELSSTRARMLPNTGRQQTPRGIVRRSPTFPRKSGTRAHRTVERNCGRQAEEQVRFTRSQSGKRTSMAQARPMGCARCQIWRWLPPITTATLSRRTDRSGLPQVPQLQRRLLPASWHWSSKASTVHRKAMPIPVCTRWPARRTIHFTPRHREITACLASRGSRPRARHTTWPPASVR